MKPVIYAALVLTLAPIQATLAHHVGIAGIRPDFCLIAACLVGFRKGALEGMGMGMALGLVQDMFSAGAWGLNLATRGLAGFLAGLAGRQMTGVTPAALLATLAMLSAISGLVYVATMGPGAVLTARLGAVQRILLPEALMNTVLGGGLYWLLQMRMPSDPRLARGLTGFLR